MLDDLIRVAKELGKNKVTIDEYNERGNFHNTTLARRFGTWLKALEKAGLEKTRNLNISDKVLFENIEEVWIKLGRQPRYNEIIKPFSKFSAGTYEKRFGTWRKGLEAFVEYINTAIDETQVLEKVEVTHYKDTQGKEIEVKHRTKREPSNRLKLRVLFRDGNRCKLCKIELIGSNNMHFDHIKPWSKGGETELDNLQILCAEHNLVKGDMEL